ncbi:MAG: thiamine phosphate synthase [Acidimicrobiales bacterium]
MPDRLAGPIVPWDLSARRLYLCTPDRPDLAEFVDSCISGGVDIVQLREKHLGDDDLMDRASVVQQVCRRHRVPFILNDRPDLAALLGADGVHVGQDDTPPSVARQIVGVDAIVGLSTHAPAELTIACGERAVGRSEGMPAPVDYLSAGPVTPTPTKPGRPGTGLAYVTQAVRRSPWPVWVTGGVDPGTVPAMIDAGARHFVVVRWLTEATEPEVSARALRLAIDLAIDQVAESS